MKCKCCKCYKELEENEQVKDDRSVWCQECHKANRRVLNIAIFVTLTIIIAVVVWVFFDSKKEQS